MRVCATLRIAQTQSHLYTFTCLPRQNAQNISSQPQTAPAPEGQTVDFLATTLLVGIDDNGQPTYKAKGGKNAKFGVKIWPEVLPALGIDPANLKPGPNPVKLHVLALMGEKGPRKVITIKYRTRSRLGTCTLYFWVATEAAFYCIQVGFYRYD